MTTKPVKLFRNGASQAVRLPADFRFEGDEIYATRNELTGDVLLSAHPGVEKWKKFFAFVDSMEDASDFMSERPLNVPLTERNLFGDEE